MKHTVGIFVRSASVRLTEAIPTNIKTYVVCGNRNKTGRIILLRLMILFSTLNLFKWPRLFRRGVTCNKVNRTSKQLSSCKNGGKSIQFTQSSLGV